jgi:hypothetical protein
MLIFSALLICVISVYLCIHCLIQFSIKLSHFFYSSLFNVCKFRKPWTKAMTTKRAKFLFLCLDKVVLPQSPCVRVSGVVLVYGCVVFLLSFVRGSLPPFSSS